MLNTLFPVFHPIAPASRLTLALLLHFVFQLGLELPVFHRCLEIYIPINGYADAP